MSFDKKLQSLRKTAGLSQEDLANELGVSRQAVSKWESGVSYPEMDKLILMTKLFKCSLDELVNDEIKDSSIMKPKASKGQAYIDSLLEFINKSINMFTSMKLGSVIKCLLELFILGFLIFMISYIIYDFAEYMIFNLIPYSLYDKLRYIGYFLCDIVILLLIALDVIIFFQFYKIRYLDYYDKLVYQFEVKKDEKKDEKQDNIEIEEDIKETKKSIKKTERIIIRDPEHRPLAFLSTISRGIIWCIKIILRLFTLPFLGLLIFSIVSFVVSLYLITYNTVFIGVSVSIVGVIGLTILIIRTINDDLFKKAYPIRLMSILLLVFIFIASIGVGLSLIKFKDIKIIEYNHKNELKENVDYNDELYLNILSASDGNAIDFVVDDSLKNVEISVEYDQSYLDYEFTKIANDKKYLLLRKYYNNENDVILSLDEFLDNLKHNKIFIYGYRYYSTITVKASEKHIRSLINNISKKEVIDSERIVYNGDTIYVVSEAHTANDDAEKVCEFNDYYNKCIYVIRDTDDSDFAYTYKNGKLEYDTKKYKCYYDEYSYVCFNNPDYVVPIEVEGFDSEE
ncbi:MAG: helix-turn-helix domain-containing protein [Erysipelotrichales bacterium]|nr:helix-turn-helix domain-containing protein [Erysipelotrichales bacterium]